MGMNRAVFSSDNCSCLLGRRTRFQRGALNTCLGAKTLWNWLAVAIALVRTCITLNDVRSTGIICLGERTIKSFAKPFYAKLPHDTKSASPNWVWCQITFIWLLNYQRPWVSPKRFTCSKEHQHESCSNKSLFSDPGTPGDISEVLENSIGL